MYTLFIDTHFKNLKLCLYKDKEVVGIKEENNIKSTGELLLPNIKELFDTYNVDIKELNKIIVCNGPGSFTGIRIGITDAKTISYLTNCDIYTITSLDLVALNNKGENLIGVKENNGSYVATYKDNKMISEIKYYKVNEITDDMNIYYGDAVDYLKLINSEKLLNKTTCYDANPIYVKTIEALNDKKDNN